MAKGTMKMAKGLGIGMVTGATALAVGSVMMKNRKTNMKKMKKSAGKAVHTVGELINGVESMLR